MAIQKDDRNFSTPWKTLFGQEQQQQQKEKEEEQEEQQQQQKEKEEEDTLQHIVERVVAGVKSIINNTSSSSTAARLPEHLTSELLGFREAATKFQVRLGVDNTNLEQEGLGIHINITAKNRTGDSTTTTATASWEDQKDAEEGFETRLIFSAPLSVIPEDNSLDGRPADKDEAVGGSPRNFRPDARGRRRLDEELLVTSPAGTVRGAAFLSPSGVEYYRFDGVPYAEPPVGELRFRPPVKRRPGRGVLNGGNRTAIVKCLQETI
jgi:hypothetical protein